MRDTWRSTIGVEDIAAIHVAMLVLREKADAAQSQDQRERLEGYANLLEAIIADAVPVHGDLP